MGPKIKRLAVWPLRHRVVSVLAIVVLAIAGYFIYQQVSLRQNKHDFEHARAAIDSVYADIVSQVGQPDDSKRINNCTNTYQEFSGYGHLSCHVDTEFIYGVKDETAATIKFQRVQKIINNSALFKTEAPPAQALTDIYVAKTYYHTASDRYNFNSLSCIVNYVFDTPSEIDLIPKKAADKPLEITLGCHGLAKEKYYSLVN